MNRLRLVAKWLGIYLLCNSITGLGLLAIFWASYPKFDDEDYIVRRSRMQMQEMFASDLFHASYRVECGVGDEQGGEREVICSVMQGEIAAAKRSYFWTVSNGLIGSEDWKDRAK